MATSASLPNPGLKAFLKSLSHQTTEDDVFAGAATLAYYWLLALFPAMIFLLSLLPYLPIENLHGGIMKFVGQMLPQETAELLSGVIAEVTLRERKGLISFGALATLWAASNGMYAIMRQLNKTYGVRESRTFLKARLTALLMTLVSGVGMLSAFSLIVFGDSLQAFLVSRVGFESAWILVFQIFRWVILLGLLLIGFSLMYYLGPNTKTRFRLFAPGNIMAVGLLILASVGFQIYVKNFGNYAATYGSLGAVIVLMLWLYLAGFVILLGSEINHLWYERDLEQI